jgi:hypothetical protein
MRAGVTIAVVDAVHAVAIQADAPGSATLAIAADTIAAIIVRITVARAIVEETVRTIAAIVVFATLAANSPAADSLRAIVVTAAFIARAVATDLTRKAAVAVAANTSTAVGVRCTPTDARLIAANLAIAAVCILIAIDTLIVPSADFAIGAIAVVTTLSTVVAAAHPSSWAAFEAAVFTFVTSAIAADRPTWAMRILEALDALVPLAEPSARTVGVFAARCTPTIAANFSAGAIVVRSARSIGGLNCLREGFWFDWYGHGYWGTVLCERASQRTSAE